MVKQLSVLSTEAEIENQKREKLLLILSAGTFLIFFQAYMVAPLIPYLAEVLNTSERMIGLSVPAYLIPYGVASLVYGILSDYIGRKRIMIASLMAFIILTLVTGAVHSALQLIVLRFLTGLGASGFIPLVLTLMGDLFPYHRRGQAIGWIFAAMAGGMTFGSSLGAVLVPLIGWRSIFWVVSFCTLPIWCRIYGYRRLLESNNKVNTVSKVKLSNILEGYKSLLGVSRGLQTYGYVLLNGIFHSGVFTWLGLYFAQRYNLGTAEIGLALFGYGIPGFLFSPTIGKAADRYGRKWLIPIGFGIAGISAGILAFDIPLIVAVTAVITLSLGYDMTQPLLAGIVTNLGGDKHRGKAMGLNVFTLFIGFGSGSFIFGEILPYGMTTALFIFCAIQIVSSFIAVPLFQKEVAVS